MKKLTALVLAATMAATSAQAAVVNTPIGKVEAETLAITTAGTLVSLAFLSNGRGKQLPTPGPEKKEVCEDSRATLENGICYLIDGEEVIVVGTGTGTATMTITVPKVITSKPVITNS